MELFSRAPDVLQIAEGSHLTPLPMEEEVSNLSAILMDGEYYEFIRAGRKETDGLPWVGAEHLIPLKARAWLDLSRRKADGETVDSKAIKKHKNDVFRLYQIITPLEEPPPSQVRQDLSDFIAKVKDEDVDLRALKVSGSLHDILDGLAKATAAALPKADEATPREIMAAVWSLVSRRVFLLYVSFCLVGAIVAGYAYSLAGLLR